MKWVDHHQVKSMAIDVCVAFRGGIVCVGVLLSKISGGELSPVLCGRELRARESGEPENYQGYFDPDCTIF